MNQSIQRKSQNSTNLFRVKEFEINCKWRQVGFFVAGRGGNPLSPWQAGDNLHIHPLPTIR